MFCATYIVGKFWSPLEIRLSSCPPLLLLVFPLLRLRRLPERGGNEEECESKRERDAITTPPKGGLFVALRTKRSVYGLSSNEHEEEEEEEEEGRACLSHSPLSAMFWKWRRL